MRKAFIASLIAVSLSFPTAALGQKAVKIAPNHRKMAEAITASQLSSYLHFIASDALGGRSTPSQGLDAAAEFLKMNVEKWGFKPAGDEGSFFQKIALTHETIDTVNTKLEINGRHLTYGEDFFRVSGNGFAKGSIVFGQDGWMVKAKNLDSFAGVDVKGKIVVISGQSFSLETLAPRPPAGITPDDLKNEKGMDWADPITHARVEGASAVILIAPPQIQASWSNWGSFRNTTTFPTKLRPNTGSTPSIPVLMVSQKVAEAIFAGESGDQNATTAFAINKNTVAAAAMRKETIWTQNVVALWEGSDPLLKSEMVAVGAHYDHIGTNAAAVGPDKIANGADDNGSGTVAVLAIAEALAKSKVKPKRSVLLVWHAGEERGLWGSEYFNKFSTVDIKKVIAQLNIDMIGRSLDNGKLIRCDPSVIRCNEELSKANEIYVIGSEMMSSTLGAITKGTNAAYQKLEYNYKYDDPKDTNRFFFRSDHFHYAENGIPIAFWFGGVHEEYHEPSDTADKIDYRKMEKITRTIFLTMIELTNLKERPKVDKKLPPELTRQGS